MFLEIHFDNVHLQVSSGQVKKMNKASMERESEVGALKKKLDTMIKLNKTLSKERSDLLEKCKTLVS